MAQPPEFASFQVPQHHAKDEPVLRSFQPYAASLSAAVIYPFHLIVWRILCATLIVCSRLLWSSCGLSWASS
jgi:hypothetical protein